MFLKINHTRFDNLKAFDDLQIVYRNWCAIVAEAAGYETFSNPPHAPFRLIEMDWEIVGERESLGFWTHYEGEEMDPLVVLFAHADDEGVILPSDAGLIADRLEEILPKIRYTIGEGFDLQGTTTKFINGLRLADAAKVPLLFTAY